VHVAERTAGFLRGTGTAGAARPPGDRPAA
jgi:hypothetical protein